MWRLKSRVLSRLSVGLCTSGQCLQRPEERNGCPGAGVRGGCEAHTWVLGMELWSAQVPPLPFRQSSDWCGNPYNPTLGVLQWGKVARKVIFTEGKLVKGFGSYFVDSQLVLIESDIRGILFGVRKGLVFANQSNLCSMQVYMLLDGLCIFSRSPKYQQMS